jgi:hypothetical protein
MIPVLPWLSSHPEQAMNYSLERLHRIPFWRRFIREAGTIQSEHD